MLVYRPMCLSRCLHLFWPGPIHCPACHRTQRVWLHVVPEALASYLACLLREWLPNIRIGVCICMLWLVLWQVFKGWCVTMWCPVFLQTEEVGVSALTESWTCFRPYTDHMSYTFTLIKHMYTPFIQPCAPDT